MTLQVSTGAFKRLLCLSSSRMLVKVSSSSSEIQKGSQTPFILTGQREILGRGIKTTSTIHPKPVYEEEEKVLEKVLQERDKSEDLPEALANPYEKPKRLCILCQHGIEPDYKNVKLLYQFTSPYTGMVYGRHITGLCKTMQAKVEMEAKKAATLGFMSNYIKEVEFLKDPKICDPDRPVRPHPH